MRIHSDKCFINIVVAITIIVTILAYNANIILAWFAPLYDSSFTGIVGISRLDYQVYYSIIEQVRQNISYAQSAPGWLVFNAYTTEAQPMGLFHPLWLVMGLIGRAVPWDAITLFHITKLLAGIGLLYFVYILSGLFLQEKYWRWLVVLGAGWFGGWGRVVTIWHNAGIEDPSKYHALFPVDLWFNEGFVYLTLNHSPLFIVTQILVVSVWWLLLSAKKSAKWWGALLFLLLGLMHPYDIPVVWAVIIVWGALLWLHNKHEARALFAKTRWLVVATGVLVAYYVVLILANPAVSGWYQQNTTLPPNFFGMLTGYGWLWLGSIYALVVLLKKYKQHMPQHIAWVIAWFLTLPILIYAPVGFSRRFIQTFGIVIIILSIMGVKWWWDAHGKTWWQKQYIGISFATVASIVVLTTVFTPLYQVLVDSSEVLNKARPVYITSQELDAVKFFNKVDTQAVVLAEPFIAYMIPGFTARRVFYGHGHQTVNHDIKLQYVQMFYSPGWHVWKQEFVHKQHIDYVVWRTDREEQISQNSNWQKVFQNDLFTIFQVQ